MHIHVFIDVWQLRDRLLKGQDPTREQEGKVLVSLYVRHLICENTSLASLSRHVACLA